MALALPSSLSPSRLSSFTSCGLQFRFSAIDRLPEPPTVAATRGTLVHAALEELFTLPAPERVPGAADACLDAAIGRLRDDPDWTGLGLDDAGEARMRDEAAALVAKYFRLEDPTTVHPVGLELKLEVEVGGVRLRGIIDRLDLVDGELVVTDYKTGRAPGDAWARQRMTGVHVYSLMCERWFGRRPVRVQLLHLAEPVKIVAEPSEQSTKGLARRLEAVWHAVEIACEREDFRPRPSPRCDWCAFQQWCPAFGGDPSQAVVDIERRAVEDAGQGTLLEV
ncbi:MAG TPA: PD-(D/E)XK nuclease family protein [Acidimicrobiales bacterium]|nr:PD-(D/E)XK nuclease family protein [Acidimicrobiales bacterium]